LIRTRSLLAAAAAAALLGLLGAGGPAAPAGGERAVRFTAADLFLDSGKNRLVAYQVEITYDRERVRVVGLEGGEPRAFSDAPHYDPAGMTGGRIVIAAFTTDDEAAPRGLGRVARLHLRVSGPGDPGLRVKVVTAAKPGGKRIDVKADLRASEKRKEERK
jgi:hypothetical protein